MTTGKRGTGITSTGQFELNFAIRVTLEFRWDLEGTYMDATLVSTGVFSVFEFPEKYQG